MKVTHLLCLGDEETEKMKYAEKFNKQREAKIWLVWEEWFWDLMEFGGGLERRSMLLVDLDWRGRQLQIKSHLLGELASYIWIWASKIC